MMEVHYYSPWDFALNSGDTTHWQYGAIATDPSAVETWGNEGYTRTEFDKMVTGFISKGVPVILGEYGAYPKGSGPGQGITTYTNYWAQYTTNAAVTRGIVPFWWDTPGGMFDRNTGAVTAPGPINAIMAGMTTNPEPAGSIGVNGS
jgi:endoglucanase